MRPFNHLLGESALERKARFLLGFGIMILATACSVFSMNQLDELTLEQTHANAPPSSEQQMGIQANRVPSTRLIQSPGYRRAKLIVVALAATILAMVYSYTVMRYVIVGCVQEMTVKYKV